MPLYYGFLEIVLLAIFSLYAWRAGWTYAPARAKDVLFTVGGYTLGACLGVRVFVLL